MSHSRVSCGARILAVALVWSVIAAFPATAQVIPRIDVLGADVPISDGLRDVGAPPEGDLGVKAGLVESLHAALLSEANWKRGVQQGSQVVNELSFHAAQTHEPWDFTASGWLADAYEHAWLAQAYYRKPLGTLIGALQAYAGTNGATSHLQSVTLPFKHAGWVGLSYSSFDFFRPVAGLFGAKLGRRFDDRLLLSAQADRALGRDDPPGTQRATSQYSVIFPLPVERFFVGGLLFAQTWTRDPREASWMDDSSVLVQYRPVHFRSFIVARLDVSRDHVVRRQWVETVAATLPLWR